MGQSSADDADEPIVGQRPLPESWPFVTTLEQDKETEAWLVRQNRKTKHAIRAKTHMETMAMSREDRAGTLWRRAEARVTSREDQASMSRGDEAAEVWFASLSKRQRQDFIAIAETTP